MAATSTVLLNSVNREIAPIHFFQLASRGDNPFPCVRPVRQLSPQSRWMEQAAIANLFGNTGHKLFGHSWHVWCVSFNLEDNRDNRWRMKWCIQLMQNLRVLSKHERTLLAQQCTFDEKIAWMNKSLFFIISSSLQCEIFLVVMIGFFLDNHKYTNSYYIIVKYARWWIWPD